MAYSPGRHGNSHGANSSGNTGRDNNPSSDGQGNGHDVILFGGKGTNGALSDTWSWNGNNWQELYPKTSPSPRYGASMSFSPGLHGKATRNRDNSPHPEDHIQHHGHHRTIGDGNGHGVVLFGGKGDNGLLSDTWSWNGDNWQELSPVTSPPALTSTASSFDPSKDEVVVATGSGASGTTGDTWAFNGRNWKEIGRGAVAPSSPTSVLTSAGDNAIYANFHAPASDNGAPIAGYVAVAEPGGEYGVVSGCNPSTSVTITGLTNGTSYLVYVFAVSVGGISAASSPSYATIPFGKPYPPTNLVATPANGSATITWDVPYDNGSPITSYTITASPGGDTETLTQTSATLSNLEDGVTYVVTATATNTAGTSLPSLPVTVTPEGTPSLPGTPSNLKAYPVKNAATVTWSPPAGNGSPVSSYTLTATPVTAALLSSDAQVVEPPVSSGGVSGTSPGIAALPKRLPMATSTPSVSSPNPCIVWWKSTCELHNSISDPTQTGDPVSTWTLVHESKLQGSTIMTITCPSSSECIAVGYVQSTTPETISPVVWRTTDTGATWTQEQLSSPASSYIELDAISCSSTADCVTVGGNGIGSSGSPTAIYTTTDGGITWTQEPVPVDVVDVSGVSCPSATTCYASGTYFTSSAGSKPVVIESQDGGSSWNVVFTSGSVVYGWLSRISCTSTTTCTAVGIQATIDYSTTPIQEQIGGYSITTSNAGASWSSSLIASGSYNLSTGTAAVAPMPMDISCTTPSNCTTDGFTAYVSVTSSGATISTITPFSYETTNQAQSWTKSVLPSLPSGTNGGLLGISCAGLSCIATGDTIDTSNQISSPLLYQSQDMGASFVQEYLPTPPTGQTYVLYGAYCFTDGSCYVTGGVGSSSTISYGAIFENTPTRLICPAMPPLPAGTPVSPPGTEPASVTYSTGGKPMSSGLITGVTPGGYYVIEIQATNAVGSGCPVWLSSGTPPYAMAEADPPTYKPGIWGPSGARPASASEPNHTGYQDVFWRAGNGDIYEMWYRGSSNSWNGPVDLTTTLWNNCNGKEFPKSTSAIQVAIADNGHEYVFWRGTDGNIWEAWSGSGNCNGTTWSLKDFGNGYETWSSVSIAVTPNGQEEDIFYAGGPTGSSGHDVFEAWYRNGHWNKPVNCPPGPGSCPPGPVNMSTKRNFPTTTSAVNVAMSSQGYEYVFWRYTDGSIYEAYTLGDGWNFKHFSPDYMTWSQVSVTVNSYNDIQTISYEGGNGDVYTTYYLPYYGWTSPQDMTQGFSLPKTDAGPSITITRTVSFTYTLVPGTAPYSSTSPKAQDYSLGSQDPPRGSGCTDPGYRNRPSWPLQMLGTDWARYPGSVVRIPKTSKTAMRVQLVQMQAWKKRSALKTQTTSGFPSGQLVNHSMVIHGILTAIQRAITRRMK